jgi:hypothetical protein
MKKIILILFFVNINFLWAEAVIDGNNLIARLLNIKLDDGSKSGINNISYKCTGGTSYDGKTGEDFDGSFVIKNGCTKLTFFIGNNIILNEINLPDLDNSDYELFITDLAGASRTNSDDPKTINIARLLYSLDSDENLNNNITIDDSNLRSEDDFTFSSTTNPAILETTLQKQYSTRELLSQRCAINHIEKVLRSYNYNIDTEPPCKPKLGYDLKATSNNTTYVELLGEEYTKIYLNGLYTGFKMDQDGVFAEFKLSTPIELNSYDEFSFTLVDSKGLVSDPTSIKIFNDPDQPILNGFSTTEILSGSNTIDINVTDTSKDHNLTDFPKLTLKYEIFDNNVSGHSSYFEFDQSTGEISVKNSPASGTYYLKIKISDQVLHYVESNLTITYTP